MVRCTEGEGAAGWHTTLYLLRADPITLTLGARAPRPLPLPRERLAARSAREVLRRAYHLMLEQ